MHQVDQNDSLHALIHDVSLCRSAALSPRLRSADSDWNFCQKVTERKYPGRTFYLYESIASDYSSRREYDRLSCGTPV
jgi:hypothetical protein